jgi:hypothetical protein
MTLGRCPLSIFCSHGTPPNPESTTVAGVGRLIKFQSFKIDQSTRVGSWRIDTCTDVNPPPPKVITYAKSAKHALDDDGVYSDYSQANSYPWSPFLPRRSRTRSSHSWEINSSVFRHSGTLHKTTRTPPLCPYSKVCVQRYLGAHTTW